jgi:hypothetical protein
MIAPPDHRMVIIYGIEAGLILRQIGVVRREE